MSPWIAACTLSLLCLTSGLDLLGQIAVDAALHTHRLAHLVAAGLLDLGAVVEEAHVDAALGQLGQQDVLDLADLEIAVGVQHQVAFLAALFDQLDLARSSP